MMSQSLKKAMAPILSRLSPADPFAYLNGTRKKLIDFALSTISYANGEPWVRDAAL
jgi:hypothetical protein